MKNNFKIFVAILSLISILSCDDQNESVSDSANNGNSKLSVDKLYDSNSNLKRQFGKALMMSLKESKLLRDLIKNESLKMFDNDYEVLYQMIKNEKLENNLSVRESILKNIESEALLNQIELNNPTLTILVPELPENSFSAELWNTDNQVPKIAIRLATSNDVPLINQDGTESIIEAKYTPAFPVIVIKDNERLISNNNSASKNIKSRTISNINGVDYKFLDDCFDGLKKIKSESSRTVNSALLDQKLITAYDTYTAANVDGWQRDYIYYGITPGTPKGPFKYDFQETIKSFSLQGDPTAAFNNIADQTGDPILPPKFLGLKEKATVKVSSWAAGNFEFKIRIIVNGKNGIGNEIVKYFNAKVSDLFTYEMVNTGLALYKVNILNFKVYPLNIPVFNWDLDQYSSTIKIDIEEVDLTQTTVLSESRSVEFASNFGVDVSGGIGEYVKIGLKYGTSQKVTATSTVQRTFTQGNDLLGDVIVNFADNVIIGNSGGTYTTREYSSGLYSISVEPARVQ